MKPTLRENYRYIAVKIFSDSHLVKEDLDSILKNEVLLLVGKIHYPKIMPKVAYFDYPNQKAIIRCLNQGVEELKVALALITSNEGKRLHIQSIYTSGTIKKAKEALSKKIKEALSKK